MTWRNLVLVVACWAMVGITATGQSGAAQAALEAARKTAVLDGNLAAAIKQYEAIVVTYGKGNRQVAAQALLQMAECHQKLGDAEAQRIYEQIVRDYGEQNQVASIARSRLGASPPAGRATQLSSRKLEDFQSLSVSGDGRFIAYTEPQSGDLGLRNVVTGERRVLTHESQGWTKGFAWGGAPFSPDGRQIAYTWDNSGNGPNGMLELRITSTDGSGQPRLVFRCNREISWLIPTAWTPDGKAILALLIARRAGKVVTSVATFAVADGQIRELKTADGAWSFGDPTISPDGAYVTYAFAPRAESQ